ncbi:hypothetical protein BD311DRAFT_234387 [Dichomitus squalens]|uniref:DUF7770 domain-containing protein n=1 Tax=Dichomitus squalens TaxID=114155 RepID=A0A4Q9MV01_9APHY|nr:hypothetical protein BD311DRAFT_234387 [Dichomitus squalens]
MQRNFSVVPLKPLRLPRITSSDMSAPEHQVEPPLRLQELQDTRLFNSQPLKSVILWCSGSMSLKHWRTSFEFNNTQQLSSEALPAQTLLRPGVYGGISADMFQPAVHEYHTPDNDQDNNLYGTLSISARLSHLLFSSRKDIFARRLDFKVAVTVKDVLELIIGQQRQYYRFNPLGSGCLYWQLLLLEAFVANGWIAKEQLDAVKLDIATYAAGLGNRSVPYPPVRGTFYSPPRRR